MVYSACDTIDTEMRKIVNSLADATDGAALAKAIANNRILENNIRLVMAETEYQLTGDADASNAIKLVRPPGQGIAPNWLRDEVQLRSRNNYRQQQQLRQRGKGGADNANNPKGKGKGKKGKGRGKVPQT